MRCAACAAFFPPPPRLRAQCFVRTFTRRRNGLPRGIRAHSPPTPFSDEDGGSSHPVCQATTYHSADLHLDAPVLPPERLGAIGPTNNRDDERLQNFKLKPRPRVASDRVCGWSHTFLFQPLSSSELHPPPFKTGHRRSSSEPPVIYSIPLTSSSPDKRLTFNPVPAHLVHQTRPTRESALSGPPPPKATSRTTSLAVSCTGLYAQSPSSSVSTASMGRRADSWMSSREPERPGEVGSRAGTETRRGLGHVDPRWGSVIVREPATEHHVQAVSSRLGECDKVPCRSQCVWYQARGGARAWIAGEPPQKKDAVQPT